ncbi:LysR family transcriptional regulator [Vibrio sp. RE86]|uniref:LysR family transcriptional regulator n=1 Tax=Vibrio sp. RE86 TaxID=2607605 RepID=UPI0014934E04|nr:LysR family transcriptional regulator [Vibrio sp. RE86]
MKRTFLNSKKVTLEQLRCFASVYENENITKAAAELCKTQSAVTLSLKKLEDQLDCALFKRSTGKLLVKTERAHDIYQNAVKLLEGVESLLLPPAKTLRFGIPDDLGHKEILALREITQRHFPNYLISFVVDKNENHNKHFTGGTIDLFFQKRLHTNLEHEDTDSYYLYSTQLIWVSHTNNINDLASRLPLVVFQEGCIPRISLEHSLQLMAVPYHIAFQSFNWQQNIEAIKSGLGIGVILDKMLDDELYVLGKEHGLPDLLSIDVHLKMADGFKKREFIAELTSFFQSS